MPGTGVVDFSGGIFALYISSPSLSQFYDTQFPWPIFIVRWALRISKRKSGLGKPLADTPISLLPLGGDLSEPYISSALLPIILNDVYASSGGLAHHELSL
jgi:hypothetical protein